MNQQIQQLKQAIAPYRQQLVDHRVYTAVRSINDLQVFMEHHVYAVWDFMSLLKSLQQQLTCTSVPWIPKGDPASRFLVNEIVLGEECDVDMNGKRISHFELYLRAMAEAGCSLEGVTKLVADITAGTAVEAALRSRLIPASCRSFVTNTFDVIDSGKAYIQAAVFTFGREDLIPGMFLAFVNELNRNSDNKLDTLKYYLERHIEVDGDHHSHLGYEMTAQLCGDDTQQWKAATDAVIMSLQQRIALWDAIASAIEINNTIS